MVECPGSSWSNPIWYGKWRIYLSSYAMADGYKYVFCHDDYDGAEDANDNRHDHATSIEHAKQLIDDWYDKCDED